MAILGVLLLVSCSGPEAKKMKFFGKGKDLYEKGELVKAKLEFKNAVQIDPKFADAFPGCLGMVALKEGDIKTAFGNLSKAVQLDPKQPRCRVSARQDFPRRQGDRQGYGKGGAAPAPRPRKIGLPCS